MPLARWQTEGGIEPEVVECVDQICLGVSCIAPVSQSLAIISEMENFQRALWETEAQREAKERRLRQERRQRARLKLERSRQELEDRVRRRHEARREERGVRVAAPVVMRRTKQNSSGANPNNPGTSFRAHRDAAGMTTSHVQSRLPFTNSLGGTGQHGAPPGMRPPSRERNMASVDLAGSLDQSLLAMRAQALAMAHEAGFAHPEATDILPEMIGGHGGTGKGSRGGYWPSNVELRSRVQAAQNDIFTPEQLQHQKLLDMHRRSGTFARTSRLETVDAGVLTLTPRGGAESGGGSSSVRSGREIPMHNGIMPPGTGRSSTDDNSTRGSCAMLGRGIGHGRTHGGLGRGGRFKNGAVKVSARCAAVAGTALTSTGYSANGAENASDQAPSNCGVLMGQRGRDTGQIQQSVNRRAHSGQDARTSVPRDKQRADLQADLQATGSRQEYMHDPTRRVSTAAPSHVDDNTSLETAALTSSAAMKEAQKREELYWIQHENTRLRRELVEPAGRVEHPPNAGVNSCNATRNPAPRAESIAGSPFYQFKIPPTQSPSLAEGDGSSHQCSLRGRQDSVITSTQAKQSVPDGTVDRLYDCSDSSRQQSSTDSDESDVDVSVAEKTAAAAAGSADHVAAGEVRPGDDVANVLGAHGHHEDSTGQKNVNVSRQPTQGAAGAKTTRPKRLTAAEARASTRGNWHGIRELLAEHGAVGIRGRGISAAGRSSSKDSEIREDIEADAGTQSGPGRWQENRAELDIHSQVQKRLGDIHAMVLDTVRWEKKKERRAEARDERKTSFRSASLEVAARAFDRGRPDLLYSSQFR